MKELFWQELFKQIMPIVTPLLCGAPVVTLLFRLINRHDRLTRRRRMDANIHRRRCESYERAFWLAEAFAKNLAQIVGPAIIAWEKGDQATAGAMLKIVCYSLCEPDGDPNTLKLKPLPDFLSQARAEVEANTPDIPDEKEEIEVEKPA